MKRLILIMLLFGPFYSLNAQNYTPLIQDGVQWDVLYPVNSNASICGYDEGYRLFFNSDSTLINGNYYHRMHSYNVVSMDPNVFCSPYQVDTADQGIVCSLREDVIEQRVYKYNFQTNQEELLYDFSLEVGDTLFYDGWSEIGHVVDSVSYLNFPDGSVRKQLCLDFHGEGNPECELMYHIEGIGSSWGPHFFAGNLVGIWPAIQSVVKNNTLIWGGPQYSVVGLEEFDLGNFKVYPNPSSGIFEIENPNIELISIEIRNVLGELVKEISPREAGGSTGIQIDLSQQIPGMYYLSVKPKGGAERSVKIIKE